MKISSFNENKNLKYNHVAPIDLDTIPKEELNRALIEFAEGSIGLEMCLRIMWANNLKTHACCAGENDDYEQAYISMSENIDIFSYMSKELLENDMVNIEIYNNRQTIRFNGPIEYKNNLMKKLAFDISQGKKYNDELIINKLNDEMNLEWLKKTIRHSMEKNNYSQDDIEFEIRGVELDRIFKYGTPEEKNNAKLELEKRAEIINEKFMQRCESRKKGL